MDFEMNFRITLAACALAAASLGAVAHEGAEHPRKSGPVVKEQTAWGIAGDAKNVKRTIELKMTDDMRFTPNVIEVRQGDVVRIVARNSGRMFHEIVIGTSTVLEEHAALMEKFPNMEHDEPYMSHVKAGTAGEIIWNFNRPGEFDFACLMPGHYQAGMVGKIKVLPAEPRKKS
jgi:uncharacterized cupredoxin-like copper-binding protein